MPSDRQRARRKAASQQRPHPAHQIHVESAEAGGRRVGGGGDFQSSFASNPLAGFEAAIDAKIEAATAEFEREVAHLGLLSHSASQANNTRTSPGASVGNTQPHRSRQGSNQTSTLELPLSGRHLAHSNSNQSIASQSDDGVGGLSIPSHITVSIAGAETQQSQSSLSPSPSPTAPMNSPAGLPRHRRRESRFLSTAAALDAQSETAILIPGSSQQLSASLAASLLGEATVGASIAERMAIPAPASGYSLLDMALARKQKKLMDILAGQGNVESSAHAAAAASAAEGNAQPATAVPSDGDSYSDGGLGGGDSDDDEDGGAPKYLYLIEDPEVKAAEQAKVERLLRVHRGNMTKSIPLSVQLNLARLHYDQYLGNLKPNLYEYAQAAAALHSPQSMSPSGAGSGAQTARSSKTHLLPHDNSFSALSAMSARLPSSHTSSLSRLPVGAGRGPSHSSSAASLSSVSSSTYSHRLRKITFLTEAHFSETKLDTVGTRHAMASVNDPLSATPLKTHMFLPYGDRFDTGEIQLLNREMLGALGNESLAGVVALPVTTMRKSIATRSTIMRSPRDTTQLEQSLKKLKEVNWGTPGPAQRITWSGETKESMSSGLIGRGEVTDSPGGVFTMTAARLAGLHSTDARGTLTTASLTGSPGPGAYNPKSDREMSSGVHARATVAPRALRETGPASRLEEGELQAKRHRNKLDVELARFSAVVKRDLADHSIAMRSPGPSAYFPKAIETKVRGAVALRIPHVPPMQQSETPGSGTYDPALADQMGTMGRPQAQNQSALASLAAAGVAANFVGFGSSSSREVVVLGGTKTARTTRTERLVDFHPMPKMTKRDFALIAADERVIAPVTVTPTMIDLDHHQQDIASASAHVHASSHAPTVSVSVTNSTVPLPLPHEGVSDLLWRSKFHLLHLPPLRASAAFQLSTMKPPTIIPKYIIPREILASRDERLKEQWLRARARTNNHHRWQTFIASRTIQAARRSRFLQLQDRELKIQLKNRLKVTQSRWLVLLVHGHVFSAYRKKHEQSHARNEVLKAVLVLQYYWRLKMQRLVSSQRFQALFATLRRSWLFMVVASRIRRRKRHVGLLVRFLQDHVANTGTKKLLNVVQRFKSCVRTMQRFMRRMLHKIRAQVDITVVQMVKVEEKENLTLAASAALHPPLAGKRTSTATTTTGLPPTLIARCATVREVLLSQLQSAREAHEAEKAAAAAAALLSKKPGGGTGAASGHGGRASIMRKAVTTMASVRLLAKATKELQEEADLLKKVGGPDYHPPADVRPSHRASVLHKTSAADLASGGGLLVRGPGGRASIVPLFQAATSSSGGHRGSVTTLKQNEEVSRPKAVTITSLAEYSLHLSDPIRRAVATEACRLRRRKHWASIQAHNAAMQRYLARSGSALHNGIELARVLLTGASARIESDCASFLANYPPPFVRSVWPRAEVKEMVYDAYLLQAHVDDERVQAREITHPRATHNANGHAIVPVPSKFQPGQVSLPIRVLVARAPLAASALDAAKVGLPIVGLLQVLALAGANVGLGLGGRIAVVSLEAPQPQLGSPARLEPPAAPPAHQGQQRFNFAGSGSGGAHSRPASAAGPHAAKSGYYPPQRGDSHTPPRSQLHGHSSDRVHRPSGHSQSPSVPLPEYDWRSQDVAPPGLLAFHATMAAALRLVGLGKPVFVSGNTSVAFSPTASDHGGDAPTSGSGGGMSPRSDPYWNDHTPGVLPALGMHIVRQQQLNNPNSSVLSYQPKTTTLVGGAKAHTLEAPSASLHRQSSSSLQAHPTSAAIQIRIDQPASLGSHSSAVAATLAGHASANGRGGAAAHGHKSHAHGQRH